jgi:endonuclease YncB( thermonuclease family)
MSLAEQTNSIPEFSLDGRIMSCKIVNIYDADTCKAVFKLDGVYVKFTLRLNGIDAPEMRPSLSNVNRDEEIVAAMRARNRLVQLVTDCDIDLDETYSKKELQQIIDTSMRIVQIECGGFDKYGRLLATLYICDTEEIIYNGVNVNNQLIEEGYGYKYDGGTKQPFTS